MARLRLDLDSETFERLAKSAVAERRPVVWQAEVILRRALGLPFPDDASAARGDIRRATGDRNELGRSTSVERGRAV